jgi:cytochrome c oxidase assembly protein subunit 15
MHETVLIEQKTPVLNLTEGKSGVQFVHRTLAYFVVACIAFLYYRSKKYELTGTQDKAVATLMIVVFIQFTLGVLTLLYSVPIALGLAHQVVAFLLLTAMTFTLHRLSK